jgi:hypothetical protein
MNTFVRFAGLTKGYAQSVDLKIQKRMGLKTENKYITAMGMVAHSETLPIQFLKEQKYHLVIGSILYFIINKTYQLKRLVKYWV